MASALRPSVCIDAVLADMPTPDALALIKELGFDAFEFWCWWEKDINELVTLSQQHDLTIAACCTKFISLVDPAARADYLAGLEASIAAAAKLSCKTLISQVGDFLPGMPREEQHASLVAGLQEAAQMLDGSDITLVIEPLNDQVDHPGYYLVRSDEAFEIIDKVASPNIKVVFDIYHQQISEGHLISNITKNISKIGHFHAAGNPGRNELTSGEIQYEAVFDAIRSTEYDGFVGLEYWPLEDPEKGLNAAKKMLTV